MRSLCFSSSGLLALALVLPLASACGGGDGTGGPDGGRGFDAELPLPDGGRDAARPDAGPGSDELCDNGLDDDGDGAIDEECPCLPGVTQGCFSGPAARRGVGACAQGTQTCEASFEFGLWGPCVGEVGPGEERCDGAVDEDCDGAIDEGCECSPGAPPVPCGSDVGACAPGTQACLDGMLADCAGAIGPLAESCNGMDDDCDGATDEGLTRPCGSTTGECRRGTETCVDGVWEACAGARGPVVEACDGLDNDCDGTVDEGLSRACGSGVGACTMGSQGCSAGTWSACTGGTMPGLELCNGIDDDCDGMTDEGLTRACGSSVGVCRPGTESCSAGRWGTCAGGVRPGTETCDGSLDEDCDGTVDEGCGCTTGATRGCGTSTGECVAGTQTCDAAGTWGPCAGAVGPVPEVCNLRDDDCDGMTDEGGVCPTSPPVVMCPAAITADVLATVTLAGSGSDPDGGAVTYAWSVTSRPTGSTSSPSPATSPTATFFLDAAGTYTVRLCVTDDEGETACCTTTVTSRAPGVLHVELSWSTGHGDADLHVLDVTRTAPDGWWTSGDCHYRNRTPDWGPAGAAANPVLDRDDTGGYGPENITINTAPASGTYAIGAHYFCEHSIGAATPAGPTEATIRVYCMGALVATYDRVRLDETDDWVTVAEVDYPSCAGRSRNVRSTGRALLPASLRPPSNVVPLHCEIACMADADCPSGEQCRSVVGPGGRRNMCVLR